MINWIPSFVLLSASTVSTISSMASNDLVSIDESQEPTTRIYGGEITKTCEFPQTVSVGGCTGTLVHPRVVISAHHCGRLRGAKFGEHVRSAVAKDVKFSWCERSGSVQNRDAQICVLKEPMLGVPIAPIIQGCELDQIKVGAKVLLAGFGFDENDPAGSSPTGEKRWVETDIRALKNKHELNIDIGGGGKGGCNGDSGGPAFLQLDDGTWRTIGATHAGATSNGSHPNCDTGHWKSTGLIMEWYEKMLAKHNETDIDLSPCFDDDGKWAPNEHCGGYTKDVKGPFGSWGDGCGKDAPVVKYSATCGEPFAPNDDDDGESNSKNPSDEPGESGKDSDGPDEGNSNEPSGDSNGSEDESGGSEGDSSADDDDSEGSPSEAPDDEDSSGEDDGSDDESESGSDESKGNSVAGNDDDDKGGCRLDGESGASGGAGLMLLAGLAWRRRRLRNRR